MNKNILAVSAGLLVAASLLPICAQACVTKSGKDCTSTVANKVDHKVKLGKVAPAANVGAVAHTSAPVGIGQVATTDLQVSPSTQEIFYIMPQVIKLDGTPVPPHLIPNNIIKSSSGIVNPDGSLTQHAIDMGWQTITVKVPGQIVVPTPTAVPSPRAPALAPAQSSINGHMQVFYHQLSPEKPKKLNKPGAHREIVASYSVEQMRSRGLINQTGRLTLQARQQGFATTITPLPGVQYYRTHNGQQIPLTPQQTQALIQAGPIGIDGALNQAAIDHGYSMVINRPAEPLPQQLAALGQAPPQTAPPQLAPGVTPAQPTILGNVAVVYEQRGIDKNQKLLKQGHDTHMVTGSYTLRQMIDRGWAMPSGTLTDAGRQNAITRTVTPLPSVQYYARRPNGQLIALTPQQTRQLLGTPSVNPDGTLTQQGIDHGFSVAVQTQPNLAPQQVVAPGQAAPNKAPTPQQVAAPNLAPQQVVAPGQAAPDKVPTPQQVAAPNLAPQQVVAPAKQHRIKCPRHNQ
ncbi:hypothetical protein [Oceanicoccus sp. KOV_DT_Chl]|uniref:hypothetical protein n=1 Tax=Oceanicoccus sp. KOV_DT_Chl TaxID=1904639 RepID=UPI000C7E849C|nr:hypothetical protein [Oceanicoccus sp. KOV_DT_Chl]